MENQVFDIAMDFHITDREMEVLELISEGYSAKEIASKLFLSTHTIISHKKSLIEKLHARNNVDLAVKAYKYSIIS